MTIKHLYPTSRPSLDLQFARDKRLDPRITYSRSSSGTYVDAAGVIQSAATNVARFDHNPSTLESLGLLVEESRTNRLGYSQNPTFSTINNDGVFALNYGLAPDGTFTATRWRPPSGLVDPGNTSYTVRFYKPIVTTAGDKVTQSIYVKPIQVISRYPSPPDTSEADTYLHIGLGANQGGTDFFNLYTLTSTGSSKIESLANGWYRFSRTYTAAGSQADDNQFFYLSNRIGVSFDPFPTGSEEVLIWGYQVETGSFPTSYIPTPATFTGRTSTATYYDSAGVVQTALTGVARSNAFFPDSSGVMRSAGLLLEEAGSNLIKNSELIHGNTADTWIYDIPNTILTINTTETLDPAGGNNADKHEITSGGGFIYATSNVSPSSTYTFSFFFKSGTLTNTVVAFFDQTNGSFVTTNATQTSKNFPNGWKRIECTVKTPSGCNILRSYMLRSVPTTGSAYFWGAQLEAGVLATSYIPTAGSTVTRSADTSTSATVTRSADVAQMTGTNFSSWYNQSEGTFLMVESASQVPQTNTHRLEIYRNGAANTDCIAHTAGPTSNSTRLVGRSSSSNTTLDVSANTTWSTTRGARAIALKQDNCALARGSSSAIDTSSVFPQNLDALGFGSPANTFQSNAVGMNTLARLTYYPVRLSDTILQNISK